MPTIPFLFPIYIIGNIYIKSEHEEGIKLDYS